MNIHKDIHEAHLMRRRSTLYQEYYIVIPTARELMHGGRDLSCYENLDISTLNTRNIQSAIFLPAF